jgi:hypothetical protein
MNIEFSKEDLETMLDDEQRNVVHRDDCLRVAMTALKAIAEFGHVGGPQCCSAAPVYECCCYEKSQWDIAKEAIKRIDILEEADTERHNAEVEEAKRLKKAT